MKITEQVLAKLPPGEDVHQVKTTPSRRVSVSKLWLQFLHDIINNLDQKSPTNLDPDLHQLAVYLKEFYTKKTLDPNTTLPETIPDHFCTAVESVFHLRQGDLVGQVVKQRVAQSGRSVVENFDWRLKWILGSSTIAELREPLCQLDLICLGSDLCKSVVSFECDLKGLEQLISVLQQCKLG